MSAPPGPERWLPAPEQLLAELATSARRLAAVDVDDLDAVLQAVADEVHRLTGGRAIVGLLEGEQLVCRAVSGAGPMVHRGDRLSVRGTLTGLAVRTGEPQLCLDALDDPRVDPGHNRRLGVRSSVVVPISRAGRVVGSVGLLSSAPGSFGPAHRDVLALMAFAVSQSVTVAVARAEGRSAREALAGSRRMLGAARQVTGAGVWEWDLATGRVDWSEEMYGLTGIPAGSLQPTIDVWNELIHPDDRAACEAVRAAAVESGDGYQQDFRLVARDGVVRHLHTWCTIERDCGGRPARAVGATIDVTELARLSRSDPVTGLFNRAVLDEQLSAALAGIGPADPDRRVALLLCDLDRFHLVNDTLGHSAGDALLGQVASRLMTSCPAGALVARMGGDEFAVLLPRVSGTGEAEDVARRLVDACRQPFVGGRAGERVVSTTTVGVAVAGSADLDPGQVLRNAEVALYQAKSRGRDGFAVFDETMRAAVEARVRTEDVLRTAMDAGRLAALYQLVVCLRTGRVVGVEALGRIVDTELGPLSPSVFVEVAEETGLILRFDHWVLQQAVELCARWRPEPPPGGAPTSPTVAVNFSSRTLEHPDVAADVARALRAAGAPGDRLLVEITEHSLLDRGAAVRRALRDLRRLGVAVGMDDFGTGWSAMSYLTGLRLQFMKIDRSFVLRIAEGDERADAVVQAIVDLGHAHGLVVIAEGVETERQAQRLREMGCDEAQGWWFARPVPAEHLDDAVATWNARATSMPWTSWGRTGTG